MVKAGEDWYHGMRHPHPKEVAFLNALDPRYLEQSAPFTLKFLLAGVGQLASPLQGAWMFSNLFFQLMKNGFPVSVQPPRHVIANICRELLRAREVTWPSFTQNRSTILFEREMMKIDHPLTTLHQDEVDRYVDQQLRYVHDPINAAPGPANETHSSEPHETTHDTRGFVDEHTRVDIHDVEHDMPSSSELLAVLEPVVIIQDFPVEVPFWVSDHLKVSTLPLDCDDATPCLTHETTDRHLHAPTQVTTDDQQQPRTPYVNEAGSSAELTRDTFEAGYVRSQAVQSSSNSAFEAGNTRALETRNIRASEAGHIRALEASSIRASEAENIRALEAGNIRASEAGNIRALVAGNIRASEAGVIHASEAGHIRTLEAGNIRASEAGHVHAPVVGVGIHTTEHAATVASEVDHINRPALTHATMTQSAPEISAHVKHVLPAKSLLPKAAPKDECKAEVHTSGCPDTSKLADKSEYPAGLAKNMHANLFAKKSHIPGVDVPQNESMTTKVDPLMLHDPWAYALAFKMNHSPGEPKQEPVKPSEPAYSATGGINQFANNKRLANTDIAPDAKRLSKEPSKPASPPAEQHQPSDDVCDQKAATNQPDSITVWVGHPSRPLQAVSAHPGETVGQLATAESRLMSLPFPVRTLTAMGSHLPVYHKLSHHQIVLLEDGTTDHRIEYPAVTGLNRQDLLWQQQGWVADDEMAFYLSMLGQPNLTNTTAPLIMENTPNDVLIFERWLGTALDKFQQDQITTLHTVCLLNQHWFPVSVQLQDDDIHLTTTHDALPTVRSWAVEALGEIFYFHYKMPQDAFPADCGFQALAWIMAQELGTNQAYPMPVEEAIKWRELFASHLIHYDLIHGNTSQLRFGGMIEPHLIELSSLLQQHGVKADRAPALVQQLVQTMGTASIKQTMGSARPWADLKTKASALQPPLKLVHSDELQSQIAERLRSGRPMGNRKTKQAKKPAQPKWTAPQASQVQIPDGIFKQQDGTPLTQITLHQLQTNQRGIAVVNLEDARPYFNLQKPLSAEGVGMLVLEFLAESLPPHHQLIRFPASCPETQEPMILTAALIQLGQQQVTRVMPQTPTSIDQVETTVLRAVLYKDQSTIPWKSMQTKPVKTVLELEHFATISKDDLLDVWDRQHLSKQYQKMKPDESELFSFVIRLRTSCVESLMQFNSKDGLYFEPRTQSGRAPCPDHRVVWLPRKCFHDVVIAKQATPQPTSIARSADRYGLRTSAQDAESVHSQHRPDVAYLDGANTKMFRIAPLPFGSTKQSLQKVFEAWEWGARPSHTQGLTPDKQGLVWIAHATEQPSFYIYTMEHGDVLISEIQSSKPVVQQTNGIPVASTRTLRCLKSSMNGPNHLDEGSSVDPLQANDPWANAYKGHTAKPSHPSPSQLATIETNVEKRVLATIQEQALWPKSEDATMDPQTDQRMSQLESQVHLVTDNLNQLTGSMATFKQQQQTHNTQVAHQVQALKTQADQQEHSMKSLLDQKMEEQIARIEALLTNKRTKTAAE
eukprot:s1318_g10.t1